MKETNGKQKIRLAMPDGFFCFFSKSQLDLLGCFGDLGQ